MNMEYAFAKGSTALAAVLTATGAGVGAALTDSVSGVNPYVVTGGVIGGALTAAVALAAKKWFEGQISKLIDLPTKSEIFGAIAEAVKAATTGQEEIVGQITSLSQTVADLRNNHLQFLEIRVGKIESRHDTEDRLYGRRAGDGKGVIDNS